MWSFHSILSEFRFLTNQYEKSLLYDLEQFIETFSPINISSAESGKYLQLLPDYLVVSLFIIFGFAGLNHQYIGLSKHQWQTKWWIQLQVAVNGQQTCWNKHWTPQWIIKCRALQIHYNEGNLWPINQVLYNTSFDTNSHFLFQSAGRRRRGLNDTMNYTVVVMQTVTSMIKW